MLYRFEWDPKKARSNAHKHKVRFENAASVFRDPKAVSIPDDEHSDDEERWLTIGMDEVSRTLVVVHTFRRQSAEECIIRIISARKATHREKEAYHGG